MYNYIIVEDGEYTAVVPELPSCCAFDGPEEEALNEIKTAIELWIEAAKKKGGNFEKSGNIGGLV